MSIPLLHNQLHEQLSQFIHPQDKRHLDVLAENLAAILLSESGCLSRWLKFLQHRGCTARSHMGRLSYFVNNPRIDAETFYHPLLRQFLSAWEGMDVTLTLDTSVFWNEYCLIEVCLMWGGRSFPLAQKVMEHPSATVAYSDYSELLATAQKLLPPNCQVTLLADRGFLHGELIRQLTRQSWHWAIRAKCDLNITRANGRTYKVADLIASQDQAYLFHSVTILEDIPCHFATAQLSIAGESWAVLSDIPASVQLFHLYGQRFGGIEPHFKDYQSAGFELPDSRLRGAKALTTLLLLLAMATLLSISAALRLIADGQRQSLDWHHQRGLSFVQLSLRQIQSLCHLRRPLPPFLGLSRSRSQTAFDSRIEFSKVTTFDF